MNRSVRFVALGAVVAIVLALIITSRRQQAFLRQSIAQTQQALQAATPVEVVRPFRRTLRETVRVMGTIKAPADITIASEITGRVVFLGVDEGDAVKAGQVLIRLDDSVIRAQVEQARAAYQQALARYRQALAGSVIPSTQADTDVEQAMAQLEQLQARLKQLQT
ncbi:MAG: hypothetical protein PVTTEEND_000071, partial [Candidatus Fervidibacter sp.]